MVAQDSPIHLLFTTTASYTLGLMALVNSTLVSCTPETVARLHFHIVSSNDDEAASVGEQLDDRFGDKLKDKVSAYGLAELSDDDQFDGLKVWAGYREADLSKVSVASWAEVLSRASAD